MKIKLIIFLCLFLSVLNAQTFKTYFGQEYNKWYVLFDGVKCPNTFNYLTCTNRTKIIDGKTYQLLYKIQELKEDTINSMPINAESTQYLREEQSSGKLFYMYENYSDNGTFISYSPEILVSDMSLNLGDSILLEVNGLNLRYWDNIKYSSSQNKYYAEVDSVYYKEGLRHVRTSALFNSPTLFEKQKTALTFIEGIGSNLSPILDSDNFAYLSDIWKLVCNVQDNTSIHFSTLDNCRLYLMCDDTEVLETKDANRFQIKLTDAKIQILFNSEFYGNIRLILPNGRLIYANSISNKNEHMINTQNIQNGVYILQILGKKGSITTTKIII